MAIQFIKTRKRVKKKQRLWKIIYLDCRNLKIFVNFPALANTDDEDHDFPGILAGL